MKLLMISTDRKIFEPGSPVALRMAEYAQKYDELHIIVFSKGSKKTPSETTIAPNCWVYSTQSFARWRYPFDAIRLGRFIIIRRGVTHITCQDPFLTAMAGVSLKRQFKLPLELQVHTDIGAQGFVYSFGNRVRKALALSYLPRVDTIRVVSPRIRTYLTDTLGIGPEKIEVRPIAVDTSKIHDAAVIPVADLRAKYPHFKKIVLMASRLEPEKNIPMVLKAWPEVIRKVPDAGLVIVGEGSQKVKLHHLAMNLGISDSVKFESWADQATLASYYKTADVFLNASLYEGYGMSLVEAHAAGIQIISTDVGIARDVGADIIDETSKDKPSAITQALVYRLGGMV